MILANEQENKPVLSNVSAGTAFKITASAKAFGILSSGLYSDKPRAIVRELSCNAYDSHVAAGTKDKPFEVHLPTAIEPWFSVRDFGVGMTKEQVMNLYSTYFDSTKTTSNDFVGALGLGSKSPFSYTDNFTVVSTREGKTCYFTAYINEQGFPSITCMAEVVSGNHSGVEVKFAVANKDFDAFRQAATKVFAAFETKPDVNVNLLYPTRNVYRSNIVPGVDLGKAGQSVALMGNIEYPIDPSMLSDESRLLLKAASFYMRFNIGELDFQASREHLSYIPMTIAALDARLKQVSDHLEVDINQKLNNIKNHWDVISIIDSNFMSPIYEHALTKYLQTHYPDLSISLKYGRLTSVFRINDYDITNAGVRLEIYRYEPYHKNKWRTVQMSKSWQTWTNNGNGTQANEYIDVSLCSNIAVAVEDSTYSVARAKLHFESSSTRYSMLYVVRRVLPDKPIDVSKVNALFRSPKNVVLTSTLAAPPRAAKVKSNTAKVKIAVLRIHDTAANSTWSEANQAVYGEGGDDFEKYSKSTTFFYVPVKGFEVISSRGLTLSAKTLASQMAHMKSISAFGMKGVSGLYAVRKDDLPKVKAAPNWINVEDHLHKIFSQIQADLALQEEVAYNVELCRSDYDLNNAWRCVFDHFHTNPVPGHRLAQPALIYKKTLGNSSPRASVYGAANTFGFQDIKGKVTDIAKKKITEVKSSITKYPLISLVTSHTMNMVLETLVDYVKMVDATEKEKS
jgi:hypothetical protein